ncbi:MAG: GTPase Era [Candidatus Magasanikbacteria bacterium RIFOXYC2_FULL_42_28]|uniref:GTPase Era n=1 Tax=Candidatus Magasanikbacteria bacterium RIFOXYC2_FULL_42_28 TaxID=1798704 RepID=A0A1F6NX75_9BACT|nr:MAG: GTPase Era [Candidatus Magasanikbacteria bacterium RIFOXYC2_FULL_42_28]
MTEEKTTTKEFKSGFVTLVGRSNTGKSTLLNSLIGTKVAAVSHRPQTTRHIIHGVLNYPEAQAVFVDTPGVLRDHHNNLSGKLEEKVKEAIADIDIIVYVVDPVKAIGAEERYIQSILRKLDIPKILVINKSDLPTEEKEFLDDYKNLGEEFTAVFELSAIFNRHVEPLRQKVLELLPAGEAIYPPDQITNINREFWIAEVVREKIFLALRQEVPYSTHVETTEIEEKPEMWVIKSTVFTSDSRYKKMIIGAGGRAIKEIGIAARKELEGALNKKVFLELEVETDRRWEERI